ncbi:MAG TPA: ABC transporter ATP-binding protein [Anaeromyxobacteraceae bacterium]|nr:ABC transporter ATP-binding protein [Anaeromyxobacteraceae bacterium]
MGALSFRFERRFREGPAIAAEAHVPLGEAPVTVLFGPSGSGKTTILRALAGLETPDSGFIRFAGETWFDAATRTLVPAQRRGVGLLFQEYALFPHLGVAANIGYGVHGLRRAERDERVREVARLCAVEDLLDRRPAQLSGGQRQRVALSRALAPRPRLLLLDEPLSALDQALREELRTELRRLLVASRVPALVVTHDRAEALSLGDRIAVVIGGRIRQTGPVSEVFAAPADRDVARVVGTENVLPAHVTSRSDGLATVTVGTATLLALDVAGAPDDVFACIRAEEVTLEPRDGAPTSARNRLAATVTVTALEGPLVRVHLDCGFPLVALVTRKSADDLRIAPGANVAALVKAPAVRLVPHGTSTSPP